MILPDKNLSLYNSLLGSGSSVLKELARPQPVSTLWDRIKKYDNVNNFEKFVLTLDLLYLLGLVNIENGLVVKKQISND